MILGLIFAAIFVYVGVNLEPGLNTTVATITTPTYSSGVAGLNGVVMIVFAAMIIFGVKLDNCALTLRSVLQTPQNGGKLKRLSRANPRTERGECVTTRWGATLLPLGSTS